MKQFLEEIYEVDPTLQDKEDEIKKIIEQMTILKPDTTAPENFKKTLLNRISEEILQNTKAKIASKDLKYNFLWYILGTGIFSSFVIGFGFLSLLDTSPTQNIALVSSEIQSMSDPIIEPRMMKQSLSPVLSDTVPDAPMSSPEPFMAKEAPKIDGWDAPLARSMPNTTPERNPEPVAMSLMSVESEVSSTLNQQQTWSIVYIWENLTIKIGTGLDFNQIKSLAQSKANLIIDTNDRSTYALDTPRVEHISHAHISEKDADVWKQAYIFPLVRTDKKESQVSEIRVIIE